MKRAHTIETGFYILISQYCDVCAIMRADRVFLHTNDASPLNVTTRDLIVPERAKILPRRISGTCALHQRKLRTAIMRARQLALIPYTGE